MLPMLPMLTMLVLVLPVPARWSPLRSRIGSNPTRTGGGEEERGSRVCGEASKGGSGSARKRQKEESTAALLDLRVGSGEWEEGGENDGGYSG